MCVSPQSDMGQNQDKLEGGEQAPGEGSQETQPSPDSEGASHQTGDVMEGGNSGEEEAGNTGENSGEPDVQDLEGSPGQEPTTPSGEKHINLWVSPLTAREVRQGGAAGREGGGGEGGRTAALVPQETHKNQKSSARIEERARGYKLYNQYKNWETETEVEHHTSSRIKMEYQDEGAFPQEDVQDGNLSGDTSYEKHGVAFTSGEANSLGHHEEDSVKVKMSRRRPHAGSGMSTSEQRDQKGSIMAVAVDEDTEHCVGTVGRLSERKGPPPAQAQHPLKNSLQKESLSDMSDTIHYRPPENNPREEIPQCEVKPVFNDRSSKEPPAIDTDERESAKPNLQIDTSETTANHKNSETQPASPTEPSSILERLLKRNRKETTPPTPAESQADKKEEDTVDDSATRILDDAAAETDELDQSGVNAPSSVCDMKEMKQKPPKENTEAKENHIKGSGMTHSDTVDTSGGHCSQPGVIGDTTSESTLTNSHYSTADSQSSKNMDLTDASVNEEMEEKPNISPCKDLPAENLLAAVSHESGSCEVSGVIAEEFAPSSVSHEKSPPTNSDGQIADSCHLLSTERRDTSPSRAPPQGRSDSESKADPQSSGPACSKDPSVGTEKVKDPTQDAAAPAVDAAPARSEEGRQPTAGIKQDPPMTLNTDNVTPSQPEKKPVTDSDDSITVRNRSQSTSSRSRPVSELIKESIQLHEKLQHQERPKPAEVKCEESGQSVKVAQMKAAFDSPTKSPDKGIERKPSMRKGKSEISL